MIATTYAVSCETARFAWRNEPPAFDEVRVRLRLKRNTATPPPPPSWALGRLETSLQKLRESALKFLKSLAGVNLCAARRRPLFPSRRIRLPLFPRSSFGADGGVEPAQPGRWILNRGQTVDFAVACYAKWLRACRLINFTLIGRCMKAGKAPPPENRKRFVKTLGLLAALLALTLTASPTCAAVIDFSNDLGPSGSYTSQAYYQGMLGGQPMTGAQQAYAEQEDQLRRLGFLAESAGDMALGQIFYRIAYGIIASPPALPSSTTTSDLVAGSSAASDTGAGLTSIGPVGPGSLTGTVVPEGSTWVMMAIGFVGLGLAGRRSRKTAAHAE